MVWLEVYEVVVSKCPENCWNNWMTNGVGIFCGVFKGFSRMFVVGGPGSFTFQTVILLGGPVMLKDQDAACLASSKVLNQYTSHLYNISHVTHAVACMTCAAVEGCPKWKRSNTLWRSIVNMKVWCAYHTSRTSRFGRSVATLCLVCSINHFYLVGGLEHDLFFPSYWECHHPNWRSPSFFRGVGLNHQPDGIFMGYPPVNQHNYGKKIHHAINGVGLNHQAVMF